MTTSSLALFSCSLFLRVANYLLFTFFLLLSRFSPTPRRPPFFSFFLSFVCFLSSSFWMIFSRPFFWQLKDVCCSRARQESEAMKREREREREREGRKEGRERKRDSSFDTKVERACMHACPWWLSDNSRSEKWCLVKNAFVLLSLSYRSSLLPIPTVLFLPFSRMNPRQQLLLPFKTKGWKLQWFSSHIKYLFIEPFIQVSRPPSSPSHQNPIKYQIL